MLNLLRDLMGMEKALIVGVAHGLFPLESIYELERFIRMNHLTGSLRVLNHRGIEFALEGSKAQLNQFLHDLPWQHAMAGNVLKISWQEYKGRYPEFHTSL